jgi:hypothetical protein
MDRQRVLFPAIHTGINKKARLKGGIHFYQTDLIEMPGQGDKRWDTSFAADRNITNIFQEDRSSDLAQV